MKESVITMGVRMLPSLAERFKRAARAEHGAMPKNNGDGAAARVLRRLVLEYVEAFERGASPAITVEERRRGG